MAFGGKTQPPEGRERQGPKGRKRQTPKKKGQKPPFERIPPLYGEDFAPKEEKPVVPDMVYPVRKSFFDFPPGIGWI